MPKPSLKSIIDPKSFGPEEKYVDNFADLVTLVKVIRDAGYSITLTQGVYDMYHVGHCRYIRDARSHGEILIIGMDSDELTRKMKGATRPFDPFSERVEIIAGMAAVNVIARRDVDQGQYDLIKLVHPDVLVMSKTTRTFTEEDKEALEPFCGKIVHLEAKAATTTTAKIRRLMIEGAQDLSDRIDPILNEFTAKFRETVSSFLKGEEAE